jgi:gliding motility-associated-like protein
MTIEVVGESLLWVPNVFSPNGDNTNDNFKATSENIVEFHGVIYDRWGLLMFEWNDANGAWDGKGSSGNPAPEGVYYYIITAKGADGQDYILRGFFTLLR